MSIYKYKPAAPKFILMALAGLVWTGVGIMLCRISLLVLFTLNRNAIYFAIAGVMLAVAVYRFLFLKIVRKNLNRISELDERSCIFAFQTWKSYLIIVIMIGLGFVLKRTSLPIAYLAVIKLAMGGALFLSSFHYYLGIRLPGDRL